MGVGKRKMVSSIYGKMMDVLLQVKRIHPFIEDFDIDMRDAKEEDFKIFNEFFTRKLKDKTQGQSIPALILLFLLQTGKILAYVDISNSDFILKVFRFDYLLWITVSLRRNTVMVHLIIRLAPSRLSSFSFPAKWNLTPDIKIDGDDYSATRLLYVKAEIFV